MDTNYFIPSFQTVIDALRKPKIESHVGINICIALTFVVCSVYTLEISHVIT